MGKHTKRLRAEKSKIKLKQKKLPKGTNISDVSFTVRKIIPLEQLKKVRDNEPVTSWNQSLKTLFSNLNHYNVNTRLNSLRGLKEILTNSPDSLRGPSLKNVVENVLQLVNDIEHKVRKTAISFLATLFNVLEPSEIIPFHEILYLHLCCAMKNKEAAIQKDSLLLVDVVMEHAQEVIKKNFKLKNFDMITNFARIMATYKYGSLGEKFLRKGSENEIELVTIANLKRLHEILSLEYEIDENDNSLNEREITCKDRILDCLELCHNVFTKENHMLVSLKRKNDVQDKGIDREKSDFESHAGLIMPILFQTWVEFSPTRQKDGFYVKKNLSENKAQILNYVSLIVKLFQGRCKRFGDSDMVTKFDEKHKNLLLVLSKMVA